MRVFYCLLAGLLCCGLQAQFTENFDSASPGDVTMQSPHFILWPAAVTPAMVTTAESLSPPHSMVVVENDGITIDDVLLQLGNKDSGIWVVSWMEYIPTGKNAYFNIQNNQDASPARWNGEYFIGLTSNGGAPGVVTHNNTGLTAPFPHDTWFLVEITVNLDNSTISVSIDGNTLSQDIVYQDNNNIIGTQLGAINFYAIDNNTRYYVDDIELYDICTDPTITGTNTYPSICPGDTSIITVSHTGQEAHYYDAETGGNLLGTGSPFTTDILYATTSFWVESYIETSQGIVCTSDRVEVVVNVEVVDLPIGDPEQEFDPGETLADLEVVGENLQWYADDQGTSPLPDTTPLVDATTYYVSQTIESCESGLLAVLATEALNTVDFDLHTIELYPNPVRDVLHIRSERELSRLALYSINGKEMMTTNEPGTQVDWKLSQLPAGVYFVEITTQQSRTIQRLLKK